MSEAGLGEWPETVVLQASRLGALGYLIGSIVLTVVFCLTALYEYNNIYGWGLAAIFGLSSLYCLWTLISPNRLHITCEGFTSSFMGRRWVYHWSDVSEFSAAEVFGTDVIVFSKLNSTDGFLYNLSRRMSGHTHALSNTFGERSEELADLMNSYRRSALQTARDATKLPS